MAAKSQLRVLADLISDSVSRIDDIYASARLEFPSLNETFHASKPAEILMLSPDVMYKIKVAVAASEQLSVILRSPAAVAFELGMGVSTHPPYQQTF